MAPSKSKPKPGDWVRSYHPGIWQVHRMVVYRGIDPVSGKEQSNRVVLVKRFVSDSLKLSLSYETVDPSYVKPLSKKDSARLQAFISKSPVAHARFSDYRPSFDAIHNARIAGTKGMTKRQVEAKIPRDLLLTELEIEPLLGRLGFDTQGMPPRWTVQFVSRDHQIKDGYLVFGFNKVLSW